MIFESCFRIFKQENCHSLTMLACSFDVFFIVNDWNITLGVNYSTLTLTFGNNSQQHAYAAGLCFLGYRLI